MRMINLDVCRIQNLHISQTIHGVGSKLLMFVEFKIYISLKHALHLFELLIVCRIQNLHISQTGVPKLYKMG